MSDDVYSACRGDGALRTARASAPRVCVRGRLAAQCQLSLPRRGVFYSCRVSVGLLLFRHSYFHLVEKLLVSTSHKPMNSLEVSPASLNEKGKEHD